MNFPHTLQGIVQKGAQRGRLLGFPTANFPLTQQVEEGIYIAQTHIDGVSYPSATFIGAAGTYGETDAKVETYILGFSQDIYGKEISIELLQKIRDNQTFTDVPSLVAQIAQDILAVRSYFGLSLSVPAK